jgi:hypothetical protein
MTPFFGPYPKRIQYMQYSSCLTRTKISYHGHGDDPRKLRHLFLDVLVRQGKSDHRKHCIGVRVSAIRKYEKDANVVRPPGFAESVLQC